jgi:hypothetical protein
MWPWQAFDWGVFWAILAAGAIYFIVANIINLLIARLQEWGARGDGGEDSRIEFRKV